MKRSELKTLVKAHSLLDQLTDDAPAGQPVTPRLHEAYDGLSQLLYYLEKHHPPAPSFWQKLSHRLKTFYWRDIVGVTNF